MKTSNKTFNTVVTTFILIMLIVLFGFGIVLLLGEPLEENFDVTQFVVVKLLAIGLLFASFRGFRYLGLLK